MGSVNRGRFYSTALPTEGGLAPRPQAQTPICQAHPSLEQCEGDAGQAPPSRCSPVRRDSGGAALDPRGSSLSGSLLCLLLVGVLRGRGRRKERVYTAVVKGRWQLLGVSPLLHCWVSFSSDLRCTKHSRLEGPGNSPVSSTDSSFYFIFKSIFIICVIIVMCV